MIIFISSLSLSQGGPSLTAPGSLQAAQKFLWEAAEPAHLLSPDRAASQESHAGQGKGPVLA